MKRRPFIGISVGGLVAASWTVAPLAAGKLARIGLLHNANAKVASPSIEAFRQGLQELGWIEGQNVSIEYRWADGHMERHPALASELVQVPVDVVVTAGPQAVRAAQRASSTIPIVAAIMPDPVALGFAASLARPGGNITGLANLFEELTPKQIQILKETMPKAQRIAILTDANMAPDIQLATEAAARALGIMTRVFQIREVTDLDSAIGSAKIERADGVHVLPSPFFDRHRARIAELAAKHRLPTISESSLYVQDGGLMSYGPDFADMWHRAASYVDRVLKGRKPGDLPIEQPTKFELVINLKTAKAIGLSIPQAILLRADVTIQ